MTKKLTLPFFVAIYLISLAAGFGLAGIRQANANASLAPTHGQFAWILVRVDDMTIERPRLVSVWAMFLTFSPGPQVFFKPLFTTESLPSKFPNLGKMFNVSADRTVSNDFMKELNRLITHQSGMVILDDMGFETFTSWFARPSSTNEVRPFMPQTGTGRPFAGEMGKYNQICETLEETTHPSLLTLPWRNLFPNHILAYPSLQSIANIWERVILSNLDTHCEVISYP